MAAGLLERAQADMSTTTIQVKAHTGMDGNERADELANEARDSACCCLAVELGNVARDGLFWPALLSSGAASSPVGGAVRSAADQCGSIKTHAAFLSKGLTNSSDYDGYWQAVMHELHQASFGFWKSGRVWLAALVQVLKARFGLTWNVKRACMFGESYKKGQAVPAYPRCPLCGGRGCIGHMLGECACRKIQAFIIE